jgi:hypothetical protein
MNYPCTEIVNVICRQFGWRKDRIALPAILLALLPENILAGIMPSGKMRNY